VGNTCKARRKVAIIGEGRRGGPFSMSEKKRKEKSKPLKETRIDLWFGRMGKKRTKNESKKKTHVEEERRKRNSPNDNHNQKEWDLEKDNTRRPDWGKRELKSRHIR